MERVRFTSVRFPDSSIAVGVSLVGRKPYISFETKGSKLGVVHFITKREWDRFRTALNNAQEEAVFEPEPQETEPEAKRSEFQDALDKVEVGAGFEPDLQKAERESIFRRLQRLLDRLRDLEDC